ncbi:MAG TPA: DUF4893 domain-containing protein [Reyranellaceae bacterium]|nr:DUF4893 domain-containing protein [Reyranellaceae bacterium]
MSSLRFACIAALAAFTAGCGVLRSESRPSGAVVVEEPTKADAWLRVATGEDQAKIERLGLAWQSALADARDSRFASELRKEGRLLEPRSGLPRPAPTPGSYNCRLIKLGRIEPRGPAYESFKPFYCYVEVEDELLTIVKQTGSERPAGRLWEDDRPERLIFLGSLALGDEQQPRAYGEDPKRDMAGVLERIGPFRWRLVIPWPRGNAKLYVFELTPVADQPE